MTIPSLESQLASCSIGDLVCCMWTDVSIGKTSTNGGIIDVPVRSWGVFVGMFGRRKHIILAQNSFKYADNLCDLYYTAIPMGWIEDFQIIAPHYIPEAALRALVASFVCCKEDQKKSLIVPIASWLKSGTTDLRGLLSVLMAITIRMRSTKNFWTWAY